MRIEGQLTGGIDQANKAVERSGAVSPFGGSATAETESSSHVPSPEIQSLLTALGQLPDVRAEVVAAAERKLASGELSSTHTIGRTATVLLG